jgi:hypothetical protein
LCRSLGLTHISSLQLNSLLPTTHHLSPSIASYFPHNPYIFQSLNLFQSCSLQLNLLSPPPTSSPVDHLVFRPNPHILQLRNYPILPPDLITLSPVLFWPPNPHLHRIFDLVADLAILDRQSAIPPSRCFPSSAIPSSAIHSVKSLQAFHRF